MKALADGLKHSSNLKIFNLEANSIGADCAKALADGVPTDTESRKEWYWY